MIPRTCGLCEQQAIGKRASMYWAWMRADNKRVAYKQLVCEDCVREAYVPLIVNAEQPVLACPACGISTVDDYDAVYLTYCLPGMPPGKSEMPFCPPCAAVLRGKAMSGAVQLEDRRQESGGSELSPPTAPQAWAALGIGGRP